MPWSRTRAVTFVFTIAALMAASDAALAEPTPEEKVRCRAAYERGQQLKLQGQPSQARVALRVCSDACPPPFSTDCDRWSGEITALLPTVRLRAHGRSGEPLSDVRVLVDGRLLADPLPSDAVAVDPGARVFQFVRRGGQPVEVTVTLEQGERDHDVSVTLDAPGASPRESVPEATNGGTSPSRLPSYVLGGLGGAALLVAGGLVVKGHVDRARLASTCAPACDPAEGDPIRTTWLTSAIVGGTGLLFAGLALLLWPRSSARASAAIVPVGGGAGLSASIRLD